MSDKEHFDLAKAIQEPKVEPIVQAYHAKIQKPYKGPVQTPAPSQKQFQGAANAYGELKHDPKSHDVQSAYGKLKQETLHQYQHLKDAGYKFHPSENPPPLPDFNSIVNHKDLQVYTGSPPPQGHPLTEKLPFKDPLGSYNNVFRAVHDVFGHGLASERAGSLIDFGHLGEDATFRGHSGLYSPQASSALATETRGQNTAFHFGPDGSHNRALPIGDARAKFPNQKAGILPPEFWHSLAIKKSESPVQTNSLITVVNVTVNNVKPKEETSVKSDEPDPGHDGNHPNSVLPDDKKSREIKSQDDNMIEPGIKTQDSNKIKKQKAGNQSDNYFWSKIIQGITLAPALTKNLPLLLPPPLHNTVQGFLGGLQSLPKGSPARGRLITAHMNHAPFLTALSAHPQGKKIHAMLIQHLNSQANAGFKAGDSQMMVKAWPKDEKENQANIANHQVFGDYAMERGKVVPHTNRKMAVLGQKLMYPDSTRTATAHDFNAVKRTDEQTSRHDQERGGPHGISGRYGALEPNSTSDTNGFWSDTSKDVGLEPQFGVGRRGVNEKKNNAKRETNKSQFPAGNFDHVFARLTGIKKP